MKRYLLTAALIVCTALPALAATEALWTSGNLIYQDSGESPANTMWSTCPILAITADPSVGMLWRDDFVCFDTARYDSVETDVAAIAMSTTVTTGAVNISGSLTATTDDDDDSYMGSKTAFIVPTAGQDIWFEATVKITEAATDDGNFAIGLSSLYTDNMLTDAGGGPAADYAGIVFFKVFNGTVWQAETSTDAGAGSQTTLTNLGTRTSGSWVRLGFVVRGTSSVTLFINGVEVGTITGTIPTTAMGFFAGVRNGSDNNEVMTIESLQVVQLN